MLSAVENVVFASVVARFDVDRTSEWYYIIVYYCGFALCHFLLFTKLGLWFVHRNRFFKHDLHVRQVMKATYLHCLEIGKQYDTAMAEHAVNKVLLNKGLKSLKLDDPEHLYALTGPEHLYALTGLKSTTTRSCGAAKIDNERDVAEDPEFLVSLEETQAACDTFKHADNIEHLSTANPILSM